MPFAGEFSMISFLPFDFCLLPFAFTEGVWLPK
jgi:hypothetical protein